MRLQQLSLVNFKSHKQQTFTFSKKISCFVGKNGVGKTNILDAIYYLGLTKSYFQSIENNNVFFGENFFRIVAEINGSESLQLVYKYQSNKKKELLINDIAEKRLADFIGRCPIVFISPDDSLLIQGGSEERRKFIDVTLSQIAHPYLESMISYNKNLEQRNAYLKKCIAEKNKVDTTLIEIYNLQLVKDGLIIFEFRKKYLEKLSRLFAQNYLEIGDSSEIMTINYQSQLDTGDFELLLRGSLQKDIALERTTVGVHRDDIDFMMNGEKVKKFGSQGQQKSFIFSLKLAQSALIEDEKKITPFLLIDDIFDKLDTERSKKISSLLLSDRYGQIFVSDTSRERIEAAFGNEHGIFDIIEINKI